MSARRIAALAVLLVPVLLVAGLGVAAGYGLSRAIRIPRVSELATYRPDIVTEIRGADGSTIARFAIERRVLIERKDIPEVMVKALLAAEDARFYDHSGIDIVRIGGALLKDIATRRLSQGASTLTQQLARAVFLSPEKTIARKVNEAFLTVEIERQFSKDQILTMYLNQIPWGHGNYGVEAASRWYFGHAAKVLTLPEAALLAGIIQRPAYYSPVRNAGAAKSRRDFVLRRMREEGYISEDQRAAAAAAPIEVSKGTRESTVGPYFCEEIRQYLEKQYGESELYREGLRVDSTLDPRLQRWAEDALRWGLRRQDRRSGFRRPRNLVAEGLDPETWKDPSWSDGASGGSPDVLTAVVLATSKTGAEVRVGDKRFALPAAAFRWTRAENPVKAVSRGDVIQIETLTSDAGKSEAIVAQDPNVEGAAVILENATGAVRALVGGYDFNRSKFDRAVQALRQVGSAFKPVVFLTAIEQGFTPADTVLDAPISITIDPKQEPWQPQNFEKKYNGIITYQYALEHSVNLATVRVDLLVGTKTVLETARRLGVRQNLLAYPSLALGAFEVTPMEMASAYASIAAGGLVYKPAFIEKIRNADGITLEQWSPEPKEATSPASAYVLLGMMKGVVQRGTAASAAKLGLNLAGKTGTTNEYSDAWFIGMTPKHTIAVWVGHDTRKPLAGGSHAQGAEVALPIFTKIVERMKAEGVVTATDDFEAPQGVVLVPVDEATGYRAAPGCTKTVLMAFVNGTQPTEMCGDQPHAVANLPQYLQRAIYAPKRGETKGDEVTLTDAPKLAAPLPKPGKEGGPPG
ncbi:MAG TPA: PBP1A family penicillin-binding protein [Thermoanaerobaculia bacterium]|nr:PBP1A family penicillin-binding protein [Thermoanaerobaculia bacterium]